MIQATRARTARARHFLCTRSRQQIFHPRDFTPFGSPYDGPARQAGDIIDDRRFIAQMGTQLRLRAEAPRRFPAPWRVDQIPGGYVVRDANRQALRLSVLSRQLGRVAATEGRAWFAPSAAWSVPTFRPNWKGEAPDLQAGGAGALVPSGFREPHCSFGEEQGILLCRRGVLTLNADDIPATRRRIPPWQS